MGGQIALEMGHLLEQIGFRNINIYLLDTVIKDEYLINILEEQSEEESMEIHEAQMICEGYDKEYAQRILKASVAEMEIGNQPVSGKLKTSRVVLFKALHEDKRIEFKSRTKIYEHIQKLKDNNVGQFAENLEVINLECHHGNIVDYVLENGKHSNSSVDANKVLTYLESIM